ncbi:iron complex transport system permease protein [Marmoricola sp. OAE513]|uniref:FecCD family ABC transporter permease n=1 Tax=Marmoricola sp. OAE513 TaxID=2817894 RepID=UPI001AE93030
MNDRDDQALVRSARTAGRGRAVVVSVLLAVVAAGAFCYSISVGDYSIPVADVPRALFGYGDSATVFIVGELRLPRALAAVLVGAAFGLSGAVFQSLARNPLASPDILGITAGASAAAVFAIIVGNEAGSALSVAALLGALGTALLIYLLAWKRGLSPYRLVLVGIAVSAVMVAITSHLLTQALITDAQRATVWLTGSLNGRGWTQVEPLLWAMLILVPPTLLMTRQLRTLQLGDDTARGLGQRVELSRVTLLVLAVALAAAATAAAGPVTFVAFVSAPIARRLVKAPLAVVPSALVGAVLVLVADLAGTQLFDPRDLPVGIITGIIGGPYLLWLLARANRTGTGG